MKIKALCQVTKLSQLERYPTRSGTTDPDYLKPKVPYVQSTLQVLGNDKGVEGYLTIDAQLRFGQFVSLVLQEEETLQAVEGMDQAIAEAEAAVDRVGIGEGL